MVIGDNENDYCYKLNKHSSLKSCSPALGAGEGGSSPKPRHWIALTLTALEGLLL